MENKKKLGTGAVVGIVILAVLSVAALVCSIIGSIQYFGYFDVTPGFVAWVIMFAAIIYYAFAGYKRPHGNLLRAIYILMSLTCLNGVIDSAKYMNLFEGNELNMQLLIVGLDGICVLLIAYMSGRLDKIRKNTIPMILITAAQIVKSVIFIPLYDPFSEYGAAGLVHIVWNFSTCILWLDIAFAYILRYREHKEAGLTDK